MSLQYSVETIPPQPKPITVPFGHDRVIDLGNGTSVVFAEGLSGSVIVRQNDMLYPFVLGKEGQRGDVQFHYPKLTVRIRLEEARQKVGALEP